MKMRPHLLGMEDLLDQISIEITTVQNKPLWISETDLDYACGQLNLCKETSRHGNIAITGGNMNRIYRFKKKIPKSIRHTDNIPGEHRPNIDIPDTSLARR